MYKSSNITFHQIIKETRTNDLSSEILRRERETLNDVEEEKEKVKYNKSNL